MQNLEEKDLWKSPSHQTAGTALVELAQQANGGKREIRKDRLQGPAAAPHALRQHCCAPNNERAKEPFDHRH